MPPLAALADEASSTRLAMPAAIRSVASCHHACGWPSRSSHALRANREEASAPGEHALGEATGLERRVGALGGLRFPWLPIASRTGSKAREVGATRA